MEALLPAPSPAGFEEASTKMNESFLSSHRFPPTVPRSFPFSTSGMYKKTVFVEFTDHLFNIAKPRPPWMGNENNTDYLL